MSTPAYLSWKNVGKIIAIGRNFAKHAQELGSKVPTEPIIFLKPSSSLIQNGPIRLPLGTVCHHEAELAVVIGKRARDIKQEQSMSFIKGYALAIDMTARNLQKEASAAGLPWTVAKGYDTFTPIGEFIPSKMVRDVHKLNLTLKVNGVVKQNGSTEEMIFKVPKLIEHISHIMTLEDNDLILTGTPEGVGPVTHGDRVECSLSEDGNVLARIEFKAQNRK